MEENQDTQDQPITLQEVQDRAILDEFVNSHVPLSDHILGAIQRLEFVSKPRAIEIARQLRMDKLPSTHVGTHSDASAVNSSLSSSNQSKKNQSKKSCNAKPAYARLPPNLQPPKAPDSIITGRQSPTPSQYAPMELYNAAAEAPSPAPGEGPVRDGFKARSRFSVKAPSRHYESWHSRPPASQPATNPSEAKTGDQTELPPFGHPRSSPYSTTPSESYDPRAGLPPADHSHSRPYVGTASAPYDPRPEMPPPDHSRSTPYLHSSSHTYGSRGHPPRHVPPAGFHASIPGSRRPTPGTFGSQPLGTAPSAPVPETRPAPRSRYFGRRPAPHSNVTDPSTSHPPSHGSPHTSHSSPHSYDPSHPAAFHSPTRLSPVHNPTHHPHSRDPSMPPSSRGHPSEYGSHRPPGRPPFEGGSNGGPGRFPHRRTWRPTTKWSAKWPST